MGDFEQLRNWLYQNKDNMIKDIIELTSIYSESQDKNACKLALEKVVELGERLELKCEVKADGQVGVTSIGQGKETLGILTHVDVVPIGDENDWSYSPYGQLVGDRLYGRGVVDNKGATVCILYVLAAMKALDIATFKRCEHIVGTMEEIQWDDIKAYIEEGNILPDYGFTPDGEFPIINRESGNCDLWFSFPFGVEEDFDLEVVELYGGSAVNSVPGKAWITLKSTLKISGKDISFTNDKIVAMGKEMHSSLPQEGDNAIIKLMEVLKDKKDKNTAFNNAKAFIIDNFGNNYSKDDKFGLKEYEPFVNGESLMATTIVPSVIRINEGNIELGVNIRLMYGTSQEEIKKAVKDQEQKYNCTCKSMNFLPPIYVSREHKFMKQLANSYQEVLNESCDFIGVGGTTYAKAMKNIVAFGPVMKGDEDKAHQIDEYMTIKTLMKSTEIFAKVVFDTLTSEESFV